uniref:Uncharacterized protein n=1 Tax=Anopheles quadriannulatus TaxID=34691 RepID=A0A182XQN9_ANOQN
QRVRTRRVCARFLCPTGASDGLPFTYFPFKVMVILATNAPTAKQSDRSLA